MNPKIQTLLTELKEQLNFIDFEIEDELDKCEKAIEIITKSIESLKKIFVKEDFKSQEKQINFFKHTKPKFTSKLIYYNMIYKIEAKKPNGGDKIMRKYLNNELHKIKSYFDNNLDFYRYHRTGNSYLDYKYFVKGKFDIKLSLDSFYFEKDKNFSTSHDYKVAKILANDLVQVYIEDKLLEMNNIIPRSKSQLNHNTKLNWTGTKVALVELLYALHTNGVFNNGAADLKEIVNYFEINFNIDLGQYRRVFLEIRARKGDKTKFLTDLNEVLLKRIENADDTLI